MITPKPYQHLTIEFIPRQPSYRMGNKRGMTHLVRITIRESDRMQLQGNPTRGCELAGKIVSIHEQEIACDGTGEGISRALRRYSSWCGPQPKRKSRRRSGVAQNAEGKIHETGFSEVGAGYGSGSDYREA